MFGLFEKKINPDEQAQALCRDLVPQWGKVIDLVAAVDGVCARQYEAGLFVGIVALLTLEEQHRSKLDALRSAFVAYWLVTLSDNPNEPDGPKDQQLTEILFERYPYYRAIEDDMDTSPVRWVLELVSNCAGEDRSDKLAECMRVVPALGEVMVQVRAHAEAAAKG